MLSRCIIPALLASEASRQDQAGTHARLGITLAGWRAACSSALAGSARTDAARRTPPSILVALAAAAWLHGIAPVAAAELRQAEPRQIDIAYLTPKNPAHEPLYRLLKDKRILEKMQELLGPFRLPRRVTLKTEGCDGRANAYSGDGNVTVCYEYLDEIWQNVPSETTPEGVEPIDALAGPLVDVFFHEFGHVVFQLLQVPVLGNEEDAADQFSAYLMLQFGPYEAKRLVEGSAYQFKRDLKPKITLDLNDFSDTHGAPAKRFYNLLCTAFGANPHLFDGLVRNGYLPVQRAIGCEDEYLQLNHAFKKLIGGNIDEALAKEVMARSWLPDAKSRPPHRPRPMAR